MPRKKSEEVTEELVEVAAVVVPAAAPAPVYRAPRVTFAQWASKRGYPKHHLGGMRAFVKNINKPRTLEEWDKAFQDY